MSGLTGYLLANGNDLSSIFLTNGGGVFTGAITTNAGIIGPSNSIQYNSSMIGYTNTIPGLGNAITISASSTSVHNLSSTSPFTLPIGVYCITSYAYNTYTTTSALSLNYFNVGINTNSNGTGAGSLMTVLGSASLLISTSGIIQGGATSLFQNASSQPYYLIENVNCSIGVSTSPSLSYVRYTRVA
jgi:hypothetical protein